MLWWFVWCDMYRSEYVELSSPSIATYFVGILSGGCHVVLECNICFFLILLLLLLLFLYVTNMTIQAHVQESFWTPVLKSKRHFSFLKTKPWDTPSLQLYRVNCLWLQSSYIAGWKLSIVNSCRIWNFSSDIFIQWSCTWTRNQLIVCTKEI